MGPGPGHLMFGLLKGLIDSLGERQNRLLSNPFTGLVDSLDGSLVQVSNSITITARMD